MRFILRYPLLSYFALAYLLTWAIEVPLMLAARGIIEFHLPPVLEAVAAFGPFAAALLVLGITQGRSGVRNLLASLGKWRVPTFWLLFALLSPFAVLFAALAVTGETGKLLSGELCNELVTAGRMLELVLFGGVLRGLGEEPGWRGYALPALRGRYGPLLATLALFPVWWLWHLPSFLMRPDFGLVQFFMFGVGILSATVWSTQLYDATRSVLMIAVWHALINICRSFAGVASTGAFMAFVQMVLFVAVVIVIYWLIKRPGPVVNNEMV